MIDRNNAPVLGAAADIKIPEPEKIILGNGIPIYVINSGETAVIKIELIFKAGAIEDKNFLMAAAANSLLDEGTRHHTAMQIAEEFEFYGAYLQTDATADWASVSLFVLNKFLDNVLPLFNEVITEPLFPEKEIETYKIQSKQRLQVNANKTDYVARKTFNQKLFGQHSAYGFYQSVADYDTIERTALAQFHAVNYLQNVFAIVVSGKVSDSVTKSIATIFGKGLSVSKNNDVVQQQFSSAPQKFHEPKKDALQSGVRMGKVLFNRTHPDFKALSILNTVFGGYFGSRLMSNIREDKGYTYGIGSGLASLRNTGYLYIATEVGVEVREATLKEIFFEIDKLRTELIPAGELDLVRNYLTGTFQRSIDGPFALSDKFKSVLTCGLDNEYFYEYLRLVHTIDAETLRNIAVKYLDKESLTIVTVG